MTATCTAEPAKNPLGLPSTETTTGNDATPDVEVAMAPTEVTVPFAVVVGAWLREPRASLPLVVDVVCWPFWVAPAPWPKDRPRPPPAVAGLFDGVIVAA